MFIEHECWLTSVALQINVCLTELHGGCYILI